MYRKHEETGEKKQNSVNSCRVLLTEEMSSRLIAELGNIAKIQMGLNPISISIHAHDNLITFTMEETLAEVEKAGAKDKRIADLIVRSHAEVYRSIREAFQSFSCIVLGRHVESSSFMLDPELNCATVILYVKE